MSSSSKVTAPKPPGARPAIRPQQFMMIGGVLLLAFLILMTKQASTTSVTTDPSAVAVESPDVQLTRALEAGQPTLAFFRSTSCDSCIQMKSIVDRVYPEFSDTITLVEVDVYDAENAQLLQKVGLRVIPTVILFDQDGNGSLRMGVVPENEMRQMLVDLQKGG